MKKGLKLFVFGWVFFYNIDLVYSQNAVFVQKISKNYAYYVELYKGENTNKAHYNELEKVFYIHKYDTLVIYLKSIQEGVILPFNVSDSAVVEGGYPLGVPTNILRLPVQDNGSILFCPSQIPDYPNYVNKFWITPASDMLTRFIADGNINIENTANKILCLLYRNASKKTPNPFSLFQLSVHWEYE